ncbi:hypothetical protein C8T65DRAFT_713946 [Cerioporus squamosus]|nr:hypothetical protein C8T65DRAFT_713946 [Cerioporus squamosus]
MLSIHFCSRLLSCATSTQFTTVVILHQNMHQNGMSDDDIHFRTALKNMQFARCMKEDIALLMRHVQSSQGPSEMGHDHFRDVSIITAWNANRDAINAERVRDFAKACELPVRSFFSSDLWGKNKDGASNCQVQHLNDSTVDPGCWSTDHDKHHAGVLYLCVDMPVLLKYNEATELCATNGAAMTVVSWDSHCMSCGKYTLDTLYVKLANPPRMTRLPGLSENVIPFTKMKKTVRCTLPADDLVVYVQRKQVTVLPNFAMTDFASQGHTHHSNVCKLEFCKNHQSIYTCLSRSSSLEGTLIVGKFDNTKIRSGTSSALHRDVACTSTEEMELSNQRKRIAYVSPVPVATTWSTLSLR